MLNAVTMRVITILISGVQCIEGPQDFLPGPLILFKKPFCIFCSISNPKITQQIVITHGKNMKAKVSLTGTPFDFPSKEISSSEITGWVNFFMIDAISEIIPAWSDCEPSWEFKFRRTSKWRRSNMAGEYLQKDHNFAKMHSETRKRSPSLAIEKKQCWTNWQRTKCKLL